MSYAAPIADGDPKFLGNIILSGESPPSNFATYWNQVTVENEGKWGNAEPNRDQMKWGAIDAAYNYAKQKGFPFKHHCFLWDLQKPNWIGNLSATEQKAEIEEWIRLYAERYPETEMVDVVNEPRDHTPTFKNAIGGDGETGWDWIVWSFETARKYLPDAVLLINEHNVEANMENALKYRNIIEILHDKKLVDGVGIQCHVADIQRNNATLDTFKHCIDTLASVGVPIYPSEFDLEGDDRKQLEDYKKIFPYLWEHPSTKGVTLWGYQGNIWNTEAVLIKRGAERPALEWLRQYVDSMKNVTGNKLPQPAVAPNNTVHIEWNGVNGIDINCAAIQDVYIRLTDMRGRSVYSFRRQSLSAGLHSLTVPSLAPGIYLVTLNKDRHPPRIVVNTAKKHL